MPMGSFVTTLNFCRTRLLGVFGICGMCVLLAAGLLPSAMAQGQKTDVPDARQIHWLAGDLPPYAWQEGGAPRGYGVELVAAMAETLNRQSPVEIVPWARAIKETEIGPNAGVMPLLRSDDREDRFRWLIVLDHIRFAFFARAGSNGMNANIIKSTDALRPRRIGVLRGSTPSIKPLLAAGFEKIVEETSYVDLLRALDIGTVDAVYVAESMFPFAIAQSSFANERFITGASLSEGDLYLAVSLKLDRAEADAWLAAYNSLLRSGAVNKLRAKYKFSRLPQ